MLSYDQVKDFPKVFRAMTGLDVEEFEALLVYFNEAWMNEINEEGENSPSQAGRKAVLDSIEDKLFFILYYFKTYPLQLVFAFLFGMSQSQACDWIHRLSDILTKALKSMGHMPERNPDQLKDTLSDRAEDKFGIDGAERKIQRPKDNIEQKKYYSGKKKTHTVKNNVIVNMDNRRVEYLSDTYEGKKHDKKICDEEQPTFPEGSTLYKDTGYQGYEPENVNTIQPKKKPRGKELTEEEKGENRLISKVRVIVEHVISGIKRCHIVKTTFRNTKDKFDDLVMEIACGLHNLRNHFRSS